MGGVDSCEHGTFSTLFAIYGRDVRPNSHGVFWDWSDPIDFGRRASPASFNHAIGPIGV